MVKSIPTVATLAALVMVAAAITFEHLEPEVWQNRLAVFPGKDMMNRHTPLHTNGTFLPPRFTENITLTSRDNPVILTNRTEIPVGVTLTLEPGVTVFAHEFAELSVFGRLRMQGAEGDPIVLTTNERHPQNQIWNGIIFAEGAQAEITQTHIQHASPALTCLPGSQATVQDSEITQALIGVFTESPDCATTNTRIQAIHEDYVRTF